MPVLQWYDCPLCTSLQVAEAKEITQFASGYKEAKRCRAYESYQLLASGCTFRQHMDTILLLVR